FERRSHEAMVVVVGTDTVLRNAELFHPDARKPIERLGVAMCKILGMVRWVSRNVPTEREADGPSAQKIADALERIHALNISRFGGHFNPPAVSSRDASGGGGVGSTALAPL